MEKEDTLNMKGIQYPVSLKEDKDISKFEKQNPEISITVLGFNEKDKYILYVVVIMYIIGNIM